MSFQYDELVQECEIPTDYLALYIESSRNVPRYESPDNIEPLQPKEMLSDNLYNHLCRLVYLAGQIDFLNGEEKDELIRMIWVHDIPEVELGDVVNILEANGVVKRQDETATARRLLDDGDFALYQRYKSASEFLKTDPKMAKDIKPDKIGLIAKMLDSIDGNLFFHVNFFKWIKSGKTELPKDAPLEWTFQQRKSYISSIKTIEDENLRNHLLAMLEFQMQFIDDLWKDYPGGMPEKMKKAKEENVI